MENHEECFRSLQQKIQEPTTLLTMSAGSSKCSIFKPSQNLVNKEIYEPTVLSIGPYYYNEDHLRMVQEHKPKYLGNSLSRFQNPDVTLKKLIEMVGAQEEKIRECYSEHVGYNSHQLVELMIIDGCFMLEMFLNAENWVHENSPFLRLTYYLPSIKRDLLKLGNQIPYFILQALTEIMYPSVSQESGSLEQLTMRFFGFELEKEFIVNRCENGVSHLLDLFRLIIVPPTTNEEHTVGIVNTASVISSATELSQHGIKFKERQDSSNLLDIKFYDKGILEIPKLEVNDFTMSYVLNLVAFEQCCHYCSKNMSMYFLFLRCLVKSMKDVELLSEKKVIETWFYTDEELVQFIQKGQKDIRVNTNHNLLQVVNQINEYCGVGCRAHWVHYKKNYFNSVAFIWTVLFVVFGMLQILFGALNYFHPSK